MSALTSKSNVLDVRVGHQVGPDTYGESLTAHGRETTVTTNYTVHLEHVARPAYGTEYVELPCRDCDWHLRFRVASWRAVRRARVVRLAAATVLLAQAIAYATVGVGVGVLAVLGVPVAGGLVLSASTSEFTRAVLAPNRGAATRWDLGAHRLFKASGRIGSRFTPKLPSR